MPKHTIKGPRSTKTKLWNATLVAQHLNSRIALLFAPKFSHFLDFNVGLILITINYCCMNALICRIDQVSLISNMFLCKFNYIDHIIYQIFVCCKLIHVLIKLSLLLSQILKCNSLKSWNTFCSLFFFCFMSVLVNI